MPVPPAIGPDDLAGLVFIYPPDAQPAPTRCRRQTTTLPADRRRGARARVTPSRADVRVDRDADAPWLIADSRRSERHRQPAPCAYRRAALRQPRPQRSGTLLDRLGVGHRDPGRRDTDADADGLSDAWETFFGLNPTSAAGDDGPAGDPDGDGVTNADEQTAGTHPRGTFRRYLAEGVANAFFDTEVALFNPSAAAGAGRCSASSRRPVPKAAWPVRVPAARAPHRLARDLRVADGGAVRDAGRVGPSRSSSTGRCAGTPAATAPTRRRAVEAPATTWYLAEGSTSGDFALFYLLQNPGDRRRRRPPCASCGRRRSRPSSAATPIGAARAPDDSGRLRSGPELASTDVSGVVTATQPIIVERAMYLSRPGQPFAAGHESAGVTAPATEWFLAEGRDRHVLRPVRADREPRRCSRRAGPGATTCCPAAAR